MKARPRRRRPRGNPIALRPRGRRVVYPEVVALVGRKRSGEEYEHWFETPVRAMGLPDGRVILEAV